MNAEDDGRYRVLPESYLLLLITVLDIIFTRWAVRTGRAVEGNPIMAYYLSKGWIDLIVVKIGIVVMAIIIAEWARSYHPEFVRWMLRFAAVSYLVMYVLAAALSSVH